MIIYYGDDTRTSRIKKDFPNSKSFDSLDNFLTSCFQNSFISNDETLILKRADEQPDISFLQKIPKNKKVVLEVNGESNFFKRLPKDINYTSVECIRDNNNISKEISETFNIDLKDSLKIATMIKGDPEIEIEKLKSLFYTKPFSLEEAEKTMFYQENIDLFQALERLMQGKKDLVFKLGSNDTISFIFSFSKIIAVLVKIRILEIKQQSYDSFMKSFKRYKKIFPHPYFVFKNIKLAYSISLERLKKLSILAISSEANIKKGVSPDSILLNIVASF
jgi:hypothetical protein